MVRNPPLILSFRQAHLCDNPFCNVSRDNCAIPIKTSTKEFCNTIATSIARYEKYRCWACELFFPLEGPGSHRGGNPRKTGKNYEIPLPSPTPENGEKCRKITKIVFSEQFYRFFGAIFPIFGGRTGEGEFCNFSPFFGDFRPGGFPGPLRAKTTRNAGPLSFRLRIAAFLSYFFT